MPGFGLSCPWWSAPAPAVFLGPVLTKQQHMRVSRVWIGAQESGPGWGTASRTAPPRTFRCSCSSWRGGEPHPPPPGEVIFVRGFAAAWQRLAGSFHTAPENCKVEFTGHLRSLPHCEPAPTRFFELSGQSPRTCLSRRRRTLDSSKPWRGAGAPRPVDHEPVL